MGKFLRSPSKVWWEENSTSHSPGAWRSPSTNSGSQDSGFSDVENSPTGQLRKDEEKEKNRVAFEKSLQKGGGSNKTENSQNLTTNVKEKITPTKNVNINFSSMQRTGSLQSTPRRFVRRTPITNTAPVSRTCPKIISSRVSRNLFEARTSLVNVNLIEQENGVEVREGGLLHQYSAQPVQEETTRENLNRFEDNTASISSSTSLLEDSIGPSSVKSLPANYFSSNSSRNSNRNSIRENWPLNLSAPAAFEEEEDDFNEENENEEEGVAALDTSLDGSDSSELECLFAEDFQPPAHTSTPKTNRKPEENLTTPRTNQNFRKMCAMNILHKRTLIVKPIALNPNEYSKDVQMWVKDARFSYDPECMTTLQCKSIAGELAEKVNNLASVVTLKIRDVSNYHMVIEQEFENIKSHKKYMKPLIQSLCGLVSEFLKKYGSKQSHCPLKEICEELKTTNEIDISKLLPKFHHLYKNTYNKILNNEAKKFSEELEDPHSEIHLRAMLTGLTSISLQNEEILSLFAKNGVIQTLVILCEKCEGSTLRGLTLRALTTICTDSFAIRQFEKASGMQAIIDTLIEDSRPEPERSEAVALLAQITAPWIEDNHSVNGLETSNKMLVKSITKFAMSTRCCQNLLLCSAALANLSTMNPSSIPYILHYNTIDILLKAVKKRGPRVSVYLLEQIAILLANVSAVEEAHLQLIKNQAAPALLCFLQASCLDDNIVKRVQQKSMVALSRLCSHEQAAKQIVDLGGVERLIHLCREKEERCNSDAVLVAALVTLRKIIESCGDSVMSLQDAQELVQPRLLDSFLAYSTQNESYV